MRLHRVDENLSGEVAPLLAYLRELQRRYHLAVVLVHHARKGRGQDARWPGAPRLEQRVVEHLTAAQSPVTAAALRKLCRVRNTTLQAALAVLIGDGRVLKDRAGYALAR